MCKLGSVDGIFKAITRFWQQLFILMVAPRGIHLPVAFAWLPDKTAVSYYVSSSGSYTMPSLKIPLKSLQVNTVRLRQIKCDFEVSIHILLLTDIVYYRF